MATAGPTTRLFLRVALVRVALSMVLSATLVAVVAAPSEAQPGGVPDPGARPAPAGEVPMPGGNTFPGGFPGQLPVAPELVNGPLAADIAEVQIEVATLTQQLDSIEPEVGPAGSAAEIAEQDWLTKSDELEAAQAKLDEVVGDSYRGAAALPPDLFIPQLPSLSVHAPGVPVEVPIGAGAAARNLMKAQAEADTAYQVYQSALTTEETLTEQRDELEDQLADLRDELEDLRDRNAEELVQAEREAEAAAQEGAEADLQPVDGYEAHTVAKKAVKFALAELGKPYLWGAEGPNRFDCSGLMLWSYNHAGYNDLPRVAADQYWGTRDRLVTRSVGAALLPGDLIFYASGPTWHSIHHVAMYIGGGRMVHAPNSRSVVKVQQVYWTGFFAATRVVPAVRVPGSGAGGDDTDPTPTPGPTRTPRPTPGPSPTQSPTPSPTPTRTNSPSPSPTSPSPDEPDPDEPDPTPTPTPTPTPSPEEPTPNPEEPTENPAEPTENPAEPTESPAGATPTATPS